MYCISCLTYVEDFETSNIQYTNEVLSLLLGVQSFVTLLHQVFENSVEHGLGHGTNGVWYLVDITTLGYEFVTDLDPGFGKSLVESGSIDTQKFADTFTFL